MLLHLNNTFILFFLNKKKNEKNKIIIIKIIIIIILIKIKSDPSANRGAISSTAPPPSPAPLSTGARCSSVVRAFAHVAMSLRIDPSWGGPIEVVLHDWCNKGRGMCNPVCGMVHIKEPLLLIGKSSPCGGTGFPLSIYVWYFTICLTPYNRK